MSSSLYRLAAATICSCALAACASTPASHPLALPAVRGAPAHPTTSAKQLVYVGNAVNGTIDVFGPSGKDAYKLVNQFSLFSSPEGLHVDSAGNLYAAEDSTGSEGGSSGSIEVYPPGSSQPSRTIVPNYLVSDVVPVKNGPDLFASNFGPTGQFGPGSVSVYGSGNSPLRTMKLPNSFQALGVVRDPATKDVFVSYDDSGANGHIARFAKGRPPAIDLNVHFGPPWGIVEDSSGNLLVADGNGAIHIYTQKGAHVSDITVTAAPYRLAFNADYSRLFVTTFNDYDVQIYSYPQAQLVGTIQSSDWNKSAWPDGVAVWPPAKN